MSDDDENHNSIANAFNGKIMIGSIAILFVACFVIVIFHVYRRWCRPGPTHHHHNRRRDHLPDIPIAVDFSPRGLDLSVVKSLPTFEYNSKSDESPLECAVCLSDFEEKETGRALPECEHCFHVACIDMWLLSHSDCPLCRAQVKAQPMKDPVEPIENSHEVIIRISGPDDEGSGSNSGLQPASQKQ